MMFDHILLQEKVLEAHQALSDFNSAMNGEPFESKLSPTIQYKEALQDIEDALRPLIDISTATP